MTPTLLWRPEERDMTQSGLRQYMNWLAQQRNLHFEHYAELHTWSVEHIQDFWQSLCEYFAVRFHTPPQLVLEGEVMPEYRWFPGASLNYAEHLFRHARPGETAIFFQSEQHELLEISWEELESQVASMRSYLLAQGIRAGDRVAAFLPNIPEASIAFMAACSIGAVWSSCSPDFGVDSVVDRFQQIEPRVLFAVDGYWYGGKAFDKMEAVRELSERLPSVERIVLVPFLKPERMGSELANSVRWNDTFRADVPALQFDPVPFEHPIWVLYSSGTTGLPKAITHSHGGVLLEHLKYLHFHNDVRPGEHFFWFSTTGWMMWNFVQASLLCGASMVLFEGSPGYPDLNVLWRFAERAKIHHFGTSAPFLVACMKAGLKPGSEFDLSGLRSIGSTGSPLPPEAFDWVYQGVGEHIWLCSMSGGTDVCTAFVGGCPLEPVYLGEIQCRALGCALEAWDEEGQPLVDEVGEMVITKPMPSMPIYFWNDPDGVRYLDSYFEHYPGVWRHGDWVRVTERGSLVIYGRSDATLNRHGVRIGTAEIYRAVNQIEAIADSLIVNLELEGGEHYMPLFVKLQPGSVLDDELRQRIRQTLRSAYSPRHVPDDIIEVPDIPYTLSGKKLETPVKKILLGHPVEKAANLGAMKNPESIEVFVNFKRV